MPNDMSYACILWYVVHSKVLFEHFPKTIQGYFSKRNRKEVEKTNFFNKLFNDICLFPALNIFVTENSLNVKRILTGISENFEFL